MERLIRRLFLPIIATLLVACSEPADNDTMSVQTDWFASTDHAALYAAEHYGYFADRGLQVEIRQGGPGIRAANDVATGRATFGLALPENIVLAAAEDVKLLSVFASYQESPIGLMVHAASNVTDVIGIANLTVQIFPGQVFWEVLKHETGIAPEEIAFDGSMTAWAENPNWAVQSFATTNPHDARKAGAEPRMLTATQLGFRSYAGVIFTSQSYASENPEKMKAFVAALQQGYADFLADPQPVIEYINNQVNRDFLIEVGEAAAEVMQVLAVSADTESRGLGAMDAGVWNDVAARMLNAGIIRREVDAATLWTNNYLPTSKAQATP
jgi:NitT/TauT family transport system substrate-binding protein